LYEEGLDENVISGSINAMANADMLIVAGTSLTVQPASGLIRFYRGSKLVLINRDATSYDNYANLVINDSLGNVFSKI
jgi:NAD-dependent deacetylase